jgi:hypothetical protein
LLFPCPLRVASDLLHDGAELRILVPAASREPSQSRAATEDLAHDYRWLESFGGPDGPCQHVPGATHLFEEPGALEAVAELAEEWFERHLSD